MRVLTAASMRAVDERAIRDLGLPSLVLMENAALGVADAIGEELAAVDSAAVFCGPGNNGGDGLAVARHLLARGYRVEAWICRGGRAPSDDCRRQLEAVRALGLDVGEIDDEEALLGALEAAAAAGVVVDALFGAGLTRPLEGLFATLVEGLSALPVPVLAVDLPSGLDASRDRPPGPHVTADLTVTFAAPKIAHLLGTAAEACGRLAVADLGFPIDLVEEVDEADGRLDLVTAAEAAAWVQPRAARSHKGTYGHVLLVAGSPGKAGAAALAARAAVRSGAGLVTAAVPESIAALVDGASLESMTLALPCDGEGRLDRRAFETVAEAWEGKAALAIGPGLGTAGETAAAIRRIALAAPLPLVLDADGINAFAGDPAALAARPAPTVLTPHPGELGRLLDRSVAAIEEDRLAAVREAAHSTGAVVLLKGHRTLVATPAGEVRINGTGNAGMASGGVGDVLTGVLLALLGQGSTAFDAAALAAWLHGTAGDRLAAERGEAGITADELAAGIGPAIAGLLAR